MQAQFNQMSQQLHSESKAKDGLQSKIKKLYSQIREQVDKKEGFDELFQQVMVSEEFDENQQFEDASQEQQM